MTLAFGSIGFVVLLVALSAVVVAAMQFEKVFVATAGLVLAFIAMAIWGDFNVLLAIWEHPLFTAAVVVGYFVFGALWAPTKWKFYVKDCRFKYDEDKHEFLRRNEVTDGKIPDKLLEEWRGLRRDNETKPPQVRDNKARVISWMTYWPWSLGWTLLNDPVRKLFRHIYRQMQDFLQGISDKAYAGVDDDFRTVSEAPEVALNETPQDVP